MVVIAPETIHQASLALGKHSAAYSKYSPAVGHNSLVMTNGPAWRALRAEFNPTFAPSTIQSFLPAIVQEGEKLVEKLADLASGPGKAHDLEAYITGATADITGHVALGGSLNAQVSDNNLSTDLTTVSKLIKGDTTVVGQFNPLRNKRIQDLAKKTSSEIRDVILKRWDHVQSAMKENHVFNGAEKRAIPIVDAVLTERLKAGRTLTSDARDALAEE